MSVLNVYGARGLRPDRQCFARDAEAQTCQLTFLSVLCVHSQEAWNIQHRITHVSAPIGDKSRALCRVNGMFKYGIRTVINTPPTLRLCSTGTASRMTQLRLWRGS
ncbi:hypothetical protein AcV7_009606 [Taiwanofungus camphoratus]|nr:hypothetical protein AcW2_007534 [Antrodia cinnamomea]KAI0947078.1 hypothetical protein AcV7_009606 [Antrodia cinnamomea]